MVANMYLARKDDKIYHISQAKKGEKGYICLCCGKPLVIYKNCKNAVDHFQHRVCACTQDENVVIAYARHLLSTHNDIFVVKQGLSVAPTISNQIYTGKTAQGYMYLSLGVDAKPDIIYSLKEKLYVIYLTNKYGIQQSEYEALTKAATDKDITVVTIKFDDLISKYKNPSSLIDYDIDKEISDRCFKGSEFKTSVNLKTFKKSITKTKTPKPKTSVLERTTALKVPKIPYGKCGVCDENLELIVNTFSDVSKPIDGLNSLQIYDFKNYTTDKDERFKIGSALLRCPKCKNTVPISCPRCAKQGKITTMKVLVNYKRQHIYICCDNYTSFTDRRNNVARTPKEKECNTSLILYSDTKSQTYSEDFKRVGGLFNWLANFDETNSLKGGE